MWNHARSESLGDAHEILFIGNSEDNGRGMFGDSFIGGFAGCMDTLSNQEPEREIGSDDDVVDFCINDSWGKG